MSPQIGSTMKCSGELMLVHCFFGGLASSVSMLHLHVAALTCSRTACVFSARLEFAAHAYVELAVTLRYMS